MGTRNLTVVVHAGKYKVAKYCQWDGYPSNKGVGILNFLKDEFDKEDFITGLYTIEELDTKIKIATLYNEFGANIDLSTVEDGFDVTNEIAEAVLVKYPQFNRDIGGNEILRIILNQYDSTEKLKIVNNLDFAADSLFCEWLYVIDLDNNTFETFKGFNTHKLNVLDRFRFLDTPEFCRDGYHPVTLVKSFNINNLPTTHEYLMTVDQGYKSNHEEIQMIAQPDHVCEANPYKNQGRCRICGKFMSKPAQVTGLFAPVPTPKDEFVSMLRETVLFVTFENYYGNTVTKLVTLMPEYLTDYQGNGSYKKANDDIVFAYDVDAQKFITIKVSKIISKANILASTNDVTDVIIPKENYNKGWLFTFLRNNVCEVTFIKKDQTERVMKCTLIPSYYKDHEFKEKDHEYKDDTITAWDIEKNGFRSFNIDSITNFVIKG